MKTISPYVIISIDDDVLAKTKTIKNVRRQLAPTLHLVPNFPSRSRWREWTIRALSAEWPLSLTYLKKV
jgi:hypothetical protein